MRYPGFVVASWPFRIATPEAGRRSIQDRRSNKRSFCVVYCVPTLQNILEDSFREHGDRRGRIKLSCSEALNRSTDLWTLPMFSMVRRQLPKTEQGCESRTPPPLKAPLREIAMGLFHRDSAISHRSQGEVRLKSSCNSRIGED